MEMEEDAAVHQAQQSPSARADLEDEPVRESAAEPGAIPTTGEAATSAANLPLPSSASSHAQDLAHSLSDFHPVDSAASVPESGGDSRSFSPSFVHIDPGIAQQEVTHSDVMNDDEEEAAFEDEDYEMNGDRYESDEAGRDSGEVEEYSGEEGEDDDRETAGAVEVIDLLDSDEAEAEENAGEENSYSGENEVNGDETSRVESSGSLDDPDSTVTSEGVPDSHDTQITVPADSVDDRRSFSLRDAQSEEVLSIPADSGGPAGSEDSRFEMDVDGDQTANVEPGSGTRPRFNANILGPSDDANPPSSTSASPEAPGHGRTATRPTSPSRDLPTTAARDEDFVADVAITASILEAAATGDPSHTAAVTEDAAHSSSGSQNLPPTVTSSNNEVARLEAPAKPSATINASSSTPATPTPKMSKLDILRQKKMKLNSEYQRLPQPQPTIEQDRQLAAPTDQNTEEPPSREQPQSQRPPQPELLPRDDFTLRRVLDSLSLQKFDASFRGAMHSVPGFMEFISATADRLSAHYENSHDEVLRTRINALEKEKSEAEAFFDSRVNDLENETQSFRLEVERLSEEVATERHRSSSLSHLLETERQTSRSLQDRFDKTSAEIQALQGQISKLDAEKRDLANVIGGKLDEKDQVQRDVSRLRSELDEAREEARTLHRQLLDGQSEVVKNRLERSAREQENEQLRKDASWLNEELRRKTEEFKAYRQEKQEIITTLQRENDLMQQEKNQLAVRAQQLQEKMEAQEKRVYSSLEKVKESEARLIASEQSFKNEMAAQQKLTNLYQSQVEDLKRQIDDLQSTVREAETGLEQFSMERDHAKETLELRTAEFQKEIEARDFKIEQLEVQSRSINSHASRSVGDIGLLSPAALAASELQRSGKTFTEIYAEFTKLQDDNLVLQRENERLTECLNHILNELNERGPMIHQFKVDKEHAEKEVARLSKELSAFAHENETTSTHLKDALAAKNGLEAQIKVLTQENNDLARQVQHLLVEIETHRSGPSSARRVVSSAPSLPSSTASGRVISERLVLFENVAALQTQNQQLRASLRSVSEAYEKAKADENRQVEAKVAQELETCEKAIEELKEQLRVSDLHCSTFMRERDQWRRMAESRGAVNTSPAKVSDGSARPKTPVSTQNEYEQLYKDLQRDFDNLRRETGSDTKALKQANEALLKEKSDLSIQIARLNSSIDYVNERYKTLSESSELQRNENNQLRDRIGTLMNNLTSQDSKAQELSNQIVELRLSLENAQTEIRQLRGERDVLRSSEARCAAENEGLMQQRNMANEHLKSLQRMYDELDRQSRDSAARSEEKLARLEKELEAVRHQLSSASDDLRTLNARRDLDMRDAQTKIEKLNGELAQALRDRDVAMFEASSGKEKVADITTRLHAMEEKLSVYEGRVGTTNQRGSEAEIIKDLQSELAQTRSDLEMAKEALQLERQRVEQYNSIASASELKLIEFNTTYDKFKEDMDAKLTESERTIAQLERLRDDLEERLSRAHTEVVSLQKKADDEKEEFKMTEDRLKDEIARIRKSDEDAQHSIRLLQEQNRAQDVRLAESMELYYGIIRKEAEHMKALQKAEEELRELRSVVDGHKAQASAAERNLKAAEKSWQLTRDTLDSEIVALQGQLTDLTEQNHILHSQFEAINTRLESLHNPSQIGAEENIQASSDKNLADVIRYLRRENDILDKKHEVALQQSIRLQQQVEHLQRSLDETRQSLDNEREQRQGVVDAEKMHKELLDKIDSLNILRESNATLRSQNEMNMKRIAFLEARLSEKDSEVGPLRASNHNLKAEIEALQAQIKQLEVDNNYWKGRTQLILAKYDRIDPVEHQQLKDRAADLQATCDSLTKQLELAKEKLAEFDSTLAEAQEARVRTEADLRRLNEESAANWADERRKLVERSNEITKRMRERLTSLTAEKSALQTQLDLLAAEKSNAESVAAAKLDELKALKATADGAAARVTSLESDLSQTQQQLKESRKIITSLELAASAPKNLIALPGGPSSTIAQSPAPVTDASTAALQPLAKAVQPPAAVNNVTAVPSPSSSVKRPREEEGPNKISVPSVVEAPSMTTAATVNLSVAPAQTPSATEEPLQKRAKTSSEGEDGEIKGMEDISPEPSAIKDDAAQVLHSSRQQQEQSLLVPPTASPVSPALAPPAKQNVAIKPPHDTPLFSALKANPVDATASVRASTSVTTTPVKIRRTGVTAESNGNDESTAVGAGNVTKPATPTGPTTSSTAPASTASPSTPIASAVVAAAKPTSTLPSLSSAPNALQPDSRQAPPSASDPPAIASDSSQKKRQLNELLRRKLAAVNQAAAPDAANGTNNPANSAQNLNLTTSTVTPPSEATAPISTPLPVRRQRIDRSSVVPVNAPATGTPSVATAENASTAGSALTQSVPILITPQPGGPGTPLPQRLGQVAGTRPIIKTREEREMHRLQQLQQQQQQQQQHPNSQQGFVLPSTVQFRAAGGGIRPVNQGGVSMFAGSNVQSGPQNQFKVPSLGQQSHQVGHPQQSLPNLQQQQQQSPQASQQQQFNIVANRGRGRINPVQRPMAGRIGVDASGHSAGMRGGGMIRGTGGQGRGGIAIVGSRMSGNGGVGVLSGGGAVGNGGAPTGPGIADPSSGGVGGSSGGVGSGGQPRPNVGGNAPQG